MTQRNHIIAHALHSVLLLRIAAAALPVVLAAATLRHADRHVEVGNLMSVLARRWHFDRSRPVVVEVAKTVGELLELDTRQRRLVQGHVEVGGEHAALSGARRHHKEVEGLTFI